MSQAEPILMLLIVAGASGLLVLVSHLGSRIASDPAEETPPGAPPPQDGKGATPL